MIGVVLAFSAVLSILMTALVFPMLHKTLPESLYLKLCTSSVFVQLLRPLLPLHPASSFQMS
jgi:hypothetical protein